MYTEFMDAHALSREAGNALSVNMVLLGALVHTGKLPITPEIIHEAIAESTKKAFVETNIRAFELGRGAMQAD